MAPPGADLVARVQAALGAEAVAGATVAELTPGVALLHVLGARHDRSALSWVALPGGARPVGGGPRSEAAVVLTSPWRESSLALHLVALLAAALADPDRRRRALAARSRADLVRVLDGEATGPTPAGGWPPAARLTLALLRTGPQGLTSAEASVRRESCGANRIERIVGRPLWLALGVQFASLFALLLWGAAAVAAALGMSQLAWAIVAVVLVNGTFGFFQEYRAERAAEALARLLPHVVVVVRDGAERRVSAVDLVPGDVIRLREGDQVPADVQVLEVQGLRVDEAALTGESRPVFKVPLGDPRGTAGGERHDVCLAGTSVVAGSGTAVVLATGMATEIGGVARLTQAVGDESSPLEREVDRLTRVVSRVALGLGLGFFLLGVASGRLGPTDGFVFALGIIVANVPEGLLPTLTLALAMGVQRMARQRAIVKRLSSVEALGATTVICTDKTGTLTSGRMSVRLLWCAGATHADTAPEVPGLRELLEAAVLASDATAEVGDPTERALVEAASRHGIDPVALRTRMPLRAPHPFDSFRKRMTLVRWTGTARVAFVKGAPEEVVARCRLVRWGSRTVPLEDTLRTRVLADHAAMAANGLRVLAVAVRTLAPADPPSPAEAVEHDLTLLGFAGLWDPPRPEVPAAVARCRRAGIRVVMVTGDSGLTAVAIARQVGLPVDQVVHGEEVERLDAEALSRLTAREGTLFARTTPLHKLRIVQALRARGEIVAVTGDGVNDAPALRAADIGVAMGQRGTEVAREAADMVLADDDFASIAAAVREGRAIWANVGRFVTYILASNVPELVPFLVHVLTGIPLPLTLMQILAVDLGTDLLPALALGAEPPEAGVMERPPRPRSERLLSRRRLLHAYGYLGAAEAAMAMAAFFWTYWLAGWRPGEPMAASGAVYQRATTMTLAAIVAAQVGNALALRSERGRSGFAGSRSSRNPFLLLAIAGEIGLFVALVVVPPLARVFGLAPLGVREWLPLCLFPFVMVLLENAWKGWVGEDTCPR